MNEKKDISIMNGVNDYRTSLSGTIDLGPSDIISTELTNSSFSFAPSLIDDIKRLERKEVYTEILNKLNSCTKNLDFSKLILEIRLKLEKL